MIEHCWFEGAHCRIVERLAQDRMTLMAARDRVGLLACWLDAHLETTDRLFGTYLAQHLLSGRSAPGARS
jgi:hypothetical protein